MKESKLCSGWWLFILIHGQRRSGVILSRLQYQEKLHLALALEDANPVNVQSVFVISDLPSLSLSLSKPKEWIFAFVKETFTNCELRNLPCNDNDQNHHNPCCCIPCSLCYESRMLSSSLPVLTPCADFLFAFITVNVKFLSATTTMQPIHGVRIVRFTGYVMPLFVSSRLLSKHIEHSHES